MSVKSMLDILQTEAILIDKEITKEGMKYYVNPNGERQYIPPSPSEIRKRYNNDAQLFQKVNPSVNIDTVKRYFNPTEEDLRNELEYWGY